MTRRWTWISFAYDLEQGIRGPNGPWPVIRNSNPKRSRLSRIRTSNVSKSYAKSP